MFFVHRDCRKAATRVCRFGPKTGGSTRHQWLPIKFAQFTVSVGIHFIDHLFTTFRLKMCRY